MSTDLRTATEEQVEFLIVYTVSRDGTAIAELTDEPRDLRPLFDLIIESIPRPKAPAGGVLQLHVANLDYNDYVGRLAIGRIFSGTVAIGDDVAIRKLDGEIHRTRITQMYAFDGLKQTPIEPDEAGEIVALAGIQDIYIGETVTSVDDPRPLPPITVDEPTISMLFAVKTSSFSGRDGRYDAAQVN